jgi:hypothetical protein
LPRPGDRQLRCVGGETRIVSFPWTAASLATLVAVLAPAIFALGLRRPSLKYQVPQDGLDSLISVSSDIDVDHIMDRLDHLHDEAAARPLCLRVVLFALVLDAAFGSILLGTAAHVASTD